MSLYSLDLPSTGLDKSGYQVNIFLTSSQKLGVGEVLLISTHNICFLGNLIDCVGV